MLSCSIRFSAPSFWMGGGPESRCVGRICGADVAVRQHPFMRIRPVGIGFFHTDILTDRRTDMTLLTVAFRNFAIATKKEYQVLYP